MFSKPPSRRFFYLGAFSVSSSHFFAGTARRQKEFRLRRGAMPPQNSANDYLWRVKTLLSVIGPTGIGKTALAIQIAKIFSTQIISCDARQIFREMPIGTAAPSEEEMQGVPHHFIGSRSVTDSYSIGTYETDALQKLEDLFTKHNVVVMVGGSGMYEKAVAEGIHDLPSASEENQMKLKKLFDEEGLTGLQQLLKTLDPDYYSQVHLENPRRLLRAIDVIWQTGEKYSSLIAAPSVTRNFRIVRVELQAPREVLYGRINLRVDKMLERGLLQEARDLEKYKHLPALQTVGYSELFKYFSGEWSLEFAVEEIKKNSRRYAKRQMTWNRKLSDVFALPFEYSQEELVSLLNKIKFSESI